MREIGIQDIEDIAPGATLLEVGTCGNTLTEAKRTGVLVGTALAELIHENGG